LYPEGEIRLLRDPVGPFITLVDPVEGSVTRTVRSVMHRKAAELAPVREIGPQPQWLAVAHGHNIYNVQRGEPCPFDGVREAFNLKPEVLLRKAPPSIPPSGDAPCAPGLA
jgi:hypothetical protein